MRTAARDWDVWSTTARVVVTEPSRLDEAAGLVVEHLAEVDLAASRFRDDSEISRLGPTPTRVSPVLAHLLREALAAARRTQGAVDPTVGAAMAALGYDRDIREVRLEQRDGRPVAVVAPIPGWRRVRLDGDVVSVPEGVQLDLGATAKAVAADTAAARVASRLRTGVLVSLGGDLATAGPAPEGGWQVLVQDTDDDPACTLSLAAGVGLATSSTVRRTWQADGESRHHILDPRTGRPASTAWRSVSVAASSCVAANAYATAAIVKGRPALGWLHREGMLARLVDEHRQVHHVGGWPQERAA
jgi:thiamine biosynthesis lipoprotein